MNEVERDKVSFEEKVNNILVLLENAKKVRQLTEIERIALNILKG